MCVCVIQEKSISFSKQCQAVPSVVSPPPHGSCSHPANLLLSFHHFWGNDGVLYLFPPHDCPAVPCHSTEPASASAVMGPILIAHSLSQCPFHVLAFIGCKVVRFLYISEPVSKKKHVCVIYIYFKDMLVRWKKHMVLNVAVSLAVSLKKTNMVHSVNEFDETFWKYKRYRLHLIGEAQVENSHPFGGAAEGSLACVLQRTAEGLQWPWALRSLITLCHLSCLSKCHCAMTPSE